MIAFNIVGIITGMSLLLKIVHRIVQNSVFFPRARSSPTRDGGILKECKPRKRRALKMSKKLIEGHRHDPKSKLHPEKLAKQEAAGGGGGSRP